MIEAVNSVISNAQVARGAASQASTLNSFAASPESIERVARAPVAPFVSPYISVDMNFDTAVLQIRDSDTGDVLTQFPSESVLQQRRSQEVRQELVQLHNTQAEGGREIPSLVARDVEISSTTFQAQQVAQSTPPSVSPAVGGEAQVAIAALSAGAQSGQVDSGSVNVTA